MSRFLVFTGLGLLVAATIPLATLGQEEDPLAPTLKALESKKKEVRLAAVRQLGSYGTAANGVVPALGKVLHADPDAAVANQAALALALAQIGWPAAEELAKAVRTGAPVVQNRALVALSRMGPQARDALEALREVLREGDLSSCTLAAQVLGEMGPAAEPAVTDLCQNLRSTSRLVRQAAAQALRNLGSVAVPGIRELLSDELSDVRLAALEALAALGPEADVAVADVTKVLIEQNPRLRATAADTLGALGLSARQALPTLLANMKDRDVDVQQSTFQALLRIGSDDMPGLLAAFRKLNQEERWAAPIALNQFGPALRDAVKPLIRDLQAADEGKRLSAAMALGEIGPEAREAASALRKALQDPSPLVRHTTTLVSADRSHSSIRGFTPWSGKLVIRC